MGQERATAWGWERLGGVGRKRAGCRVAGWSKSMFCTLANANGSREGGSCVFRRGSRDVRLSPGGCVLMRGLG